MSILFLDGFDSIDHRLDQLLSLVMFTTTIMFYYDFLYFETRERKIEIQKSIIISRYVQYKFYYGCNLPYNNIIINPNNIPECHFDDDDSIEEKNVVK